MHFFSEISFVIFICFVTISRAKIGFVKDQSVDRPFPPIIEKSYTGIPDGHLRPLGYQRRAEKPIASVQQQPSPHEFNIKYVLNNKPVNFKGAMLDLPVMELWDDDQYLKDTYGMINMTVIVRRGRAFDPPKKMLFKKYLRDYMYDDWFISSTIPQEMMIELPLPPFLQCGSYKRRLIETELWMSSGDLSSKLHSHEYHDLHCVLFGRKDMIFIDNQYQKSFAFHEKFPNAGAGESDLDMDMINVFKYKAISTTPWTYTTLRPGDCVFIPSGYPHQVRSYGRSVSFATLFSPTKVFDSSDCQSPDLADKDKDKNATDDSDTKSPKDKIEAAKEKEKKLPNLSNVKFVWTYTGGERRLTMGTMKGDDLRDLLLLMMRDQDKMTYEQFEHFYLEIIDDPSLPTAREAFDLLLVKKKKKEITRTQLEEVPSTALYKVASIFNDVHKKGSRHDEL
ncbi:hypothetical protein ScPMuIL_008847 [Solemya velum]